MDAIIVGAGLSGLSCAHDLTRAHRKCLVLEAGHEIGGRMRTDRVDGYQFDRGFHIFFTEYPAAKQLLDYPALQLRPFRTGLLVRSNGRFTRLAAPWRSRLALLPSLASRIGSYGDKLRLARLRRDLRSLAVSSIYQRTETSTIHALNERGFSDWMIDSFFRPLLGSHFLESGLETSSRMFEFLFHMMAMGDAYLPATGIQAIPRQLADRLPPGTIRTESRVEGVAGNAVYLAGGERLEADAIVIATSAPDCRALLHDPYPAEGRSVSNLYYSTDRSPINESTLVLNGDESGPINHLAEITKVAPEYGPRGKAVVSISVLGFSEDLQQLDAKVRRQLADWYPRHTEGWELVKSYRIRYARPAIPCPGLTPVEKPAHRDGPIFVCGDHCDTPSINGAIASGRRAAEAILATISV